MIPHPKTLLRGSIDARAFAETVDMTLGAWNALGRELIGRKPALVIPGSPEESFALLLTEAASQAAAGFAPDPDEVATAAQAARVAEQAAKDAASAPPAGQVTSTKVA